MKLHSLLLRQLKRLGLTADSLPPTKKDWLSFLSKVSNSYNDSDQERYLLERSLMISSSEMQERWHVLTSQQEKLVTTAKLATLGEMAGSIAHEINNPLVIILTCVKILERELQKEPMNRKQVYESLLDIQHTVERISKIVTSLKTVYRDSGEFKVGQTTLREILNDTLEICAQKFKSKSIELRIDFQSKILDHPISCDRIQLFQVFINLLNNACDAVEIQQEKWIEVTISELEGEFIIKFIDSGPGVPPEIRPKLFLPFFTTKEIGKGTGLGLPISKSIVDKHHGTLELDPQAPHTCFVLKLPKRSSPEKKAS